MSDPIEITSPANNSQFTTEQPVTVTGINGPVGTVTITPTSPDVEVQEGITGWTVLIAPFGTANTYTITVTGLGNSQASINVIIVNP